MCTKVICQQAWETRKKRETTYFTLLPKLYHLPATKFRYITINRRAPLAMMARLSHGGSTAQLATTDSVILIKSLSIQRFVFFSYKSRS